MYAAASSTTTAGFESLFREKPVFLFGHCFYQYASGIHRIRSIGDCRRAVDSIFVKKEHPSLRDARLYLMAISRCGSTYEGAELSEGETDTVEQQAVLLGEHLATLLKPIEEELKRKMRA